MSATVICGAILSAFAIAAFILLMCYMHGLENKKVGALRIRREESVSGKVRFIVEEYRRWDDYLASVSGWDWYESASYTTEEAARAHIADIKGGVIKSNEILP